jgi:hypothetical protein
VRSGLHVRIARNNNVATGQRESSDPGRVVAPQIVWIVRRRVVGLSLLNNQIGAQFQQLLICGEGLKNFHHGRGYVLVKRYLQAALWWLSFSRVHGINGTTLASVRCCFIGGQ